MLFHFCPFAQHFHFLQQLLGFLSPPHFSAFWHPSSSLASLRSFSFSPLLVSPPHLTVYLLQQPPALRYPRRLSPLPLLFGLFSTQTFVSWLLSSSHSSSCAAGPFAPAYLPLFHSAWAVAWSYSVARQALVR